MYHSRNLPEEYTDLDMNRITVLYFAVAALDLLDSLHVLDRDASVDFVFRLQLSSSPALADRGHFGFIGGTYMAHNSGLNKNIEYIQGHVAMIYTALIILISLGDDLSRVDRESIAIGLKKLQQEDGSFTATLLGTEADVRFVYCACAIASILELWSCIDIDRAINYILQCRTYEGGFGLRPGGETQGGATYCAIAALFLMKQLPTALTAMERQTLLNWCFRREQAGYEGRTSKDPDTCYCFWVGATIAMLSDTQDISLTEQSQTRNFILHECQNPRYGGFSKFPDGMPDILHSYYSLCWLAMSGDLSRKLYVPLGITAEAWQQFETQRQRSSQVHSQRKEAATALNS
jgi:geranylgeranyl transferase type-1 subunit beta